MSVMRCLPAVAMLLLGCNVTAASTTGGVDLPQRIQVQQPASDIRVLPLSGILHGKLRAADRVAEHALC